MNTESDTSYFFEFISHVLLTIITSTKNNTEKGLKNYDRRTCLIWHTRTDTEHDTHFHEYGLSKCNVSGLYLNCVNIKKSKCKAKATLLFFPYLKMLINVIKTWTDFFSLVWNAFYDYLNLSLKCVCSHAWNYSSLKCVCLCFMRETIDQSNVCMCVHVHDECIRFQKPLWSLRFIILYIKFRLTIQFYLIRAYFFQYIKYLNFMQPFLRNRFLCETWCKGSVSSERPCIIFLP